MGYQTVHYAVEGAVATITLNRPDARNAVDDQLMADFSAALTEAVGDDQIRAIVITGAGKGFCAGADVRVLASIEDPTAVEPYILENYKPLITAIMAAPKPVIAAVNGFAAGAGASIALACDFRVMAEDASILMAFINIGLVPDAGATWFLTRQLGYSRALEIAIEGKPFAAAQCLETGLANRVVASEQVVAEAQQWAAKLATRPTLAIARTKEIANRAMLSTLEETIADEAKLQVACMGSHDHREGVAAFLEKRPARFEGR